MLLLGDPLPSTKLHALGLIARCVPAAELEAEASKVINRLAANAPLSLKAMKALTVRQPVTGMHRMCDVWRGSCKRRARVLSP
jgi:enoyl-CoA hydratase/carnithine racemase